MKLGWGRWEFLNDSSPKNKVHYFFDSFWTTEPMMNSPVHTVPINNSSGAPMRWLILKTALMTNAPAPKIPVIRINFFMNHKVGLVCYIFALSQRGAQKVVWPKGWEHTHRTWAGNAAEERKQYLCNNTLLPLDVVLKDQFSWKNSCTPQPL